MTDDLKTDLSEIINQIISGKVDANRKFIDGVLEHIQDATHKYYLKKLTIEAMQLEAAEKEGNLQAVLHHKVMLDTYKGLLEKTFAPT